MYELGDQFKFDLAKSTAISWATGYDDSNIVWKTN